MQPVPPEWSDQLVRSLNGILYRCLEEMGSTKAALYLAVPGPHAFRLACHYGWPRIASPPEALGPTDPLVVLLRRERRNLALNDGEDYPELQPFSLGKPTSRYFLSPIFTRGEWIGVLLQKDPNRDQPYSLDRQRMAIEAICQEIIQALKRGSALDAPEPPGAPTAPLQAWDAIRVPAPPTFPEQQTFFWEAARLLCQVVPTDAVALWVNDPLEDRPILAYSALPLSPRMEQQIIDHAAAQLPHLDAREFQILTHAEGDEQPPLPGLFRTLLPTFMEEPFGDADLMMVFRTADQPFLPNEQEFIRGVARMLGLYLQEGRLHERYHQSFLSVSQRILASAGEKVPSIRAHSVNTAELSRSLARRLELSSPEVEAVCISAILHDVGTLLLDRKMLEQPTLSPEDLEKVHTHPILASTFLKGLHFPFDVLRIIRHHHEQWDGNGYPDGIAGPAIPIESQIIHLVESFQVMTSGTSYRAPKAVPEALGELRQLAGSHFDPRLVEKFVAMVESVS